MNKPAWYRIEFALCTAARWLAPFTLFRMADVQQPLLLIMNRANLSAGSEVVLSRVLRARDHSASVAFFNVCIFSVYLNWRFHSCISHWLKLSRSVANNRGGLYCSNGSVKPVISIASSLFANGVVWALNRLDFL